MSLEQEIHQHLWSDVTDEFHDALLRMILSREAIDPGLQVSNVNGWHSAPDLLDWGGPIISEINDRIRRDAASIGAGDLRMHAWANVMRVGAYQMAHKHGDAVWSGVYYVAAGNDEGGEIKFARGSDVYVISPRTALSLLFSSNLLHSVNTYHGVGPRVSVAFNLF